MSFIFMAFHWPESEHRDALARSMLEMGEVLRDMPGCLDVEPPFLNTEDDSLVGISRWESREAFFAADLTLLPADEIVPGETRPRERFLLDTYVPLGG